MINVKDKKNSIVVNNDIEEILSGGDTTSENILKVKKINKISENKKNELKNMV